MMWSPTRDDGAVVTDSPSKARTLANYNASVYRTDEWSDHLIMNAPGFTSASVHKDLSTFNTAKGSGSDDLHPFM